MSYHRLICSLLFSSATSQCMQWRMRHSRTLAEDAIRKKCIQFTTLTALRLNSIQHSNTKRVQGTLGITMQAWNTFLCALSTYCVLLRRLHSSVQYNQQYALSDDGSRQSHLPQPNCYALWMICIWKLFREEGNDPILTVWPTVGGMGYNKHGRFPRCTLQSEMWRHFILHVLWILTE